jgi:outer membrane lipoprotein-sorting protein
MVPRKVQTLVNGETQALVQISKVEFNVPVDDARFKMPAQK